MLTTLRDRSERSPRGAPRRVHGWVHRCVHRHTHGCRAEALEYRWLLSASPNVLVTVDADVQQMPSVAVDPHAPRHVVMAYMDRALVNTGYAGIGVAVSRDAGATWQRADVPLPTGFDQGAANPTVQFDDQGHLFVSFMAVTFLGGLPPITNGNSGPERALGFESNNGLFVSRSDDGGEHWDAPIAVVQERYDGVHRVPFEVHPALAIDRSPRRTNGQANPLYGTLYVTWARYYPAGLFPEEADSTGSSELFVASSADHGRTWRVRTKADAAGIPRTVLDVQGNDGYLPEGFGYASYPHPAVGPDGDVYISCFFAGHFGVDHSADGAASFFVPDFEQPAGQPIAIGAVVLQNNSALEPQNQFRTPPSRAIAADPLHPGVVYAADVIRTLDTNSNVVDRGDVVFSFSTDYGQTWHAPIVVNDDNANQHPTGTPDDVTADQVMVRLDVGSDGKIGLEWLDTRRDPASTLLDVFGAVGTFGTDASGQPSVTFSPNFRTTDRPFDANLAAFSDPAGGTSYYIGDSIGLAMAGDSMYAAWTDTRNANQDIAFANVPLTPTPPPANDRFEPNDTPATATPLGGVVVRHVPRLAVTAGDDDWFTFQSLATGQITITANTDTTTALQLDLLDSTGQAVLATAVDQVNAHGTTTGKQLVAPARAGQTYLIHVHRASGAGDAAAADETAYSLDVQSLTDNLGALAHATVGGRVAAGDQAYYLMQSAAAGSMEAALSPGPDLHGELTLEWLDADSLSVLASDAGAAPQVKVQVNRGQRLLLHVSAGADTGGAFDVDLTNLDQYSDPELSVLHFPAGSFPSQEAVADFNGDGTPDVAIADAGANLVSVLLANGDGTFQAPRQFEVGAARFPNPEGVTFELNAFRRAIVAADFNGDGLVDLAVTNYDSADVSILLGRGDGTFQPQRRYDATPAPFGITAVDVNHDGISDLLVTDAPLAVDGSHLAVLLGRGDGTFAAERLQPLPTDLADASLTAVDLNGDGNLDLAFGGGQNDGLDVLLGDGFGSFAFVSHFPGTRQSPELITADLNRDGHPDVLAASLDVDNSISFLPGNGDGTLQSPQAYLAGQSPIALALTDWGSVLADGTFRPGEGDGLPDAIVADVGISYGSAPPSSPPQIVVLPNLGFDADGNFLGFGDPIRLALADQPLDLKVADFNHDGAPDIGVVDRNEFFVIYGKPPAIAANASRQSARNLGTVVHVLEPTLTIVPQRPDAWYKLNVPTEAAGNADEVVDVAANFSTTSGGGLAMQVLDARGTVLGDGPHVRVTVPQGSVLYIHISAQTEGVGAYALDIDVLPQLVSVQSQSLLHGGNGLPAGATSTLVLVFQGDRLDQQLAEDLHNYTVTWLGSDAGRGGRPTRVLIPIGVSGVQSAVYNPGSNVDVSSGRAYPTAERQTVTLLFQNPLPAGNYLVSVLARVVAARFNDAETDASARPVVGVTASGITVGASRVIPHLVPPPGIVHGFSAFKSGTPFLSQLQGDLSALLDQRLSNGLDATITAELLAQMGFRLRRGLAGSSSATSFLAIFLDPLSLDVTDPGGGGARYDLRTGAFDNGIADAYVAVANNIELIVLPTVPGQYTLDVANVPAAARGGAVLISADGRAADRLISLTADLRVGQTHFDFTSSASTSAPANELPGNFTAVTAVRPALPGEASPTVVASGELTAWEQPVAQQQRGAATANPQLAPSQGEPIVTRHATMVWPWQLALRYAGWRSFLGSIRAGIEPVLNLILRFLSPRATAAAPGQPDRAPADPHAAPHPLQLQPADVQPSAVEQTAEQAVEQLDGSGTKSATDHAADEWATSTLATVAFVGASSRRSRRCSRRRQRGGVRVHQ